MYVIGFNGPPEAGKDSVAKALADLLDESTTLPIRVVSIVEPLARMGATLLGVKYTDEWYTQIKSSPIPLFDNLVTGKMDTFREWMIAMVEQFYKPRYGRAFFSRALLMQQIQESFQGILLVTNIGFSYEIDLFEGALGPERVALVQVSRMDKDFSNDSRGPVTGTNTFHIFNAENHLHDAVARLHFMITAGMPWNLR